jgi:hypothetical protein
VLSKRESEYQNIEILATPECTTISLNTSMNTFREFIISADSPQEFSDTEIFSMYNDVYSPKTVREISKLSGRSVGNIYQTIERYGGPNRQGRNYHLIFNYAANGLGPKEIAERTGYTERGVRNILNRGN